MRGCAKQLDKVIVVQKQQLDKEILFINSNNKYVVYYCCVM